MKIFKIADVREILDSLDRGEISYSKMVELLNEHALKWYENENKKITELNILSKILKELQYEKNGYDDPGTYMGDEWYDNCKSKSEAYEHSIRIVEQYIKNNKI